ncbi:MAG: aminopeptidase P N-terminal domain-containing protein, partial [Betaproteobacteria bacterium]
MNHAHQIYRARRDAVLKTMRDHAGGGVALVPTAPEVARNRDSNFPYRHDSYFYYLSGFPEPEAVVALIAGPDGDRHVLFCRDRSEEREIWDGFRYGPDAAKEIFGFDEAHSIGELRAKLPDLTADRPALYTPLGLFGEWDRQVTELLNEVRNRVRTGVAAPDEVVDVRGTLDAMRLVKDRHELELMRRAASISADAHRRAMATTKPGWFEYQVEAELLHEFMRHGAQ